MKKILLLCTALALAGCSSAPGESDIEKFLEPKFESCNNLEITEIKKTNGYEEDDHYIVEFTYAIEIKKPRDLRNLKKRWQEENDQAEKTFLEKWPGYVFQRISPNDSLYKFYYSGCSGAAKKLIPNHFDIYEKGFNEDDIEMTAKIPMRKTENGWRALSDS